MKKLFSIFLIIASINSYGQKISDLTTATGQGTGGYLPIVQSGTTKKILADSLAEHIKRYAAQQAALRLALTDTSGMLDPYKVAINAARALANTNATAITTKQNILVSGTDIKTINSISLLGSGNITISGGSGGGIDSGAYRSITHPNDTTFILVRSNGLRDTIVFSIGATPVNLIPGTNVTITGTYPNLTIAATPANNGWGLTPNTVANPATTKFGTASNNSIHFVTNNVERMRLDSTGGLLIGTGTPTGDNFEVMSGNARIQNRLKFADGSGFTIEDRLIRSYGALSLFDISTGTDAFGFGGSGAQAGPNVTSFRPLPNHMQFMTSGGKTYLKAHQYDYGGGEDFFVIMPNYHFGGGTGAMGNMYLSVGKNTTNNIYGKIILGHDGTSATGPVLIMTAVDYADNAAAVAAGLTVGTIYRTGDVVKIVH